MKETQKKEKLRILDCSTDRRKKENDEKERKITEKKEE